MRPYTDQHHASGVVCCRESYGLLQEILRFVVGAIFNRPLRCPSNDAVWVIKPHPTFLTARLQAI